MRLSLAFEMQRPAVDDHAVIDTVWFVEHHFLTSFSMSPCPEVLFGAANRTVDAA